MKLRAYSATEPTGLDWMPTLPSHWKVKPLKAVVAYNPEALPEDTPPDYEMEYIEISSVSYTSGIEATERHTFEKAPSRARRVVRDGDTIVSTVRTYLKAVATIRDAPDNLIASTGFVVLRPAREIDAGFLGYYAKSQGFVDAIVAQSVGVSYPATNASDVVRLPVAIPPTDEQTAIVRFLDAKTAEIDALIAKKRRLLDLLAEQRAALITRAVTKGIDRAAPLKPSGSRWLGNVPDHWEVKRLKFVVPSMTVGIVITPSKYYEPEGVPALRGVNINTGQIVEDDMVFLSPASNELHAKSKIYEGDIVVVRTGKPGTAAVVPRAFHGANCIDLLIIRKSEMLDSDFCLYFMNSRAAEAQVVAASVGAIQSHFNTSTLAELEVPLPPIDEQRAIVQYTFPRLSRLDAFSSATTNAIRSLEEYRAATITAAVTGQIDVRNWSAKRAAA